MFPAVPRQLAIELQWVSEKINNLRAARSRPTPKIEALETEGVGNLLDEISGWPVDQLSPVMALKAVRRWQVFVRQLLPERYEMRVKD